MLDALFGKRSDVKDTHDRYARRWRRTITFTAAVARAAIISYVLYGGASEAHLCVYSGCRRYLTA